MAIELTRERWERARVVLEGGDDEVVSRRSAAAKAGVTLSDLRRWVKRSRERRVEDEDWIHEICGVWDRSFEEQAGKLEDVAWSRAIVGVDKPVIHQGKVTCTVKEVDNRVLLRMLEARDPRYGKKVEHNHRVKLEPGERFLRFQGMMRNRLGEMEAGRVIEGESRDLGVEPKGDGVGLVRLGSDEL